MMVNPTEAEVSHTVVALPPTVKKKLSQAGKQREALEGHQPSAAPDTTLATETVLLKHKGLSGYKLQQVVRAELKKSRKKLHGLLYQDSHSDSDGSDTDSLGMTKRALNRRRRHLKQGQESTTHKLYMGDMNQVSNCWFVTCMFDDVPIEALVDTGAETSVISHRMLRQLGTDSHSVYATIHDSI